MLLLTEIVAIILGVFVVALFPTLTYLYVEKRSRKHWVDAAGGRAPMVVRAASFWSLALGQACVLWLAIPVVCGALVFSLSKVGHGSGLGYVAVIFLGVVAILQALASLSLVPLGIRMLARGSNLRKRASTIARVLAGVHLAALAAAGGTYALMFFTDAFHRIIRVGLVFGVALPIGVFALLSLALAFLISRAQEIESEIKVVSKRDG